METFKIFFFVLLLSLVFSACKEDDVVNKPGPTNDLSIVDNKVKAFMDKFSIPGASLAVAKNEKMVYAKGYGFADTASREFVNTKHVFRIASISKMFTGIGILKLVEDGKLNLTDKVFGPSSLLGDNFGTATLTSQELQITVDHLLHNSFGGWGLASGGDPIDYFPNYDKDQFIEYVLKTWDLKYPIEDTYVYSNTGYWLLARIIEEVSGQSYLDFTKNLVRPAGVSTLHFTTFRKNDRRPNEVEYYGQNGESQYIYSIASRRDGDAGGVISASDLLRTVCAINKLPGRQDILTSSTLDLLRGSGPLSPNWGRGIGFWDQQRYWWMTGSLPGTRSWLNCKYDGLSIVLILNSKSLLPSFDTEYNQLMQDLMNNTSIPWDDSVDLF